MTGPPYDLGAERAVLGACLLAPAAVADVQALVDPGDFYQPGHEAIYRAILNAHRAGRVADPVVVKDELEHLGRLTAAGGTGYLADLPSAVASPANVSHYATIVRDHARRRDLIATAEQVASRAAAGRHPVEELIDEAHSAFAGLRYGRGGDELDSLLGLDEFCDQDLPALEWVVPDLLARGDRLIITGAEGLGKTTLIRQLAVAAASGLHPFDLRREEPRTVLVIDTENPLRIMTDRFTSLRNAVIARGTSVEPGRLWIDRRPGGMDLATTADQRWLERRVETINPDLLVIGPAYKLYVGGSQSREEDLARAVTSVLDRLREIAGCALILEHHSPHGTGPQHLRNTRPFGSSLWLRWPEFGLGIRLADLEHNNLASRVVDVQQWRGPRDDRAWPEMLRSGPDGWPWVATTPDGRRTGR